MDVAPMVRAERTPLECIGAATCMVEDGYMRLDAPLVDEPGKIACITIFRVGRQTLPQNSETSVRLPRPNRERRNGCGSMIGVWPVAISATR